MLIPDLAKMDFFGEDYSDNILFFISIFAIALSVCDRERERERERGNN